MRIGVDYTAAVNQRAGIGRFVRELVAALLEADEDNHYMLLLPPGQKVPCPSGAESRHLPFSPRLMTIFWHRLGLPLPAELFTGALDLFHSPDFVLPPLRNTRAIVTVHDLSFMVLPQCAAPGLVRYLNRVVPRSIERATLVLADSVSTMKDLASLLGVPEAKVAVVPGGVGSQFHPVTEEDTLAAIRRRYNLDGPFILGVGTLEPRKNWEGLVEAFHRLRREMNIPHRLVVAGGKGWLWEGIFRRVAELGLEEEITFLGFVPEADLPPLLSLADVFAYPSLYEGFGLPPLEAMACGTPVVASNVSSLPEVLGEAALLVAPGDTLSLAEALYQVLSEEKQRHSLSEKGRAQAARFTWEAAAQKMITQYRRLAQER
ncbi:MAG: glycosyltransferase family 4 protein [Chloroflexi bacterium]|nr:glycosyltransferase family 4 protein [Chloroflexota bacterium]